MTGPVLHADVETPVGWLTMTEEDGAITRLTWGRSRSGDLSPVLEDAVRQLREFFADERREFDLPLAPGGSDFQRAVCAAMLSIPYGATRSYGEIASQLGAPAQAIGQACGANPIPIIIPCHRVVGRSGLGGFSGAGGVEMKVRLLRHEGAYSLLI